jgi:hypothetical protein
VYEFQGGPLHGERRLVSGHLKFRTPSGEGAQREAVHRFPGVYVRHAGRTYRFRPTTPGRHPRS